MLVCGSKSYHTAKFVQYVIVHVYHYFWLLLMTFKNTCCWYSIKKTCINAFFDKRFLADNIKGYANFNNMVQFCHLKKM